MSTTIARTFPVRQLPDMIGVLMSHESGTLDYAETLELFSYLLATDTIGRLQGSYGRAAAALIKSGQLTRDGSLGRKAVL